MEIAELLGRYLYIKTVLWFEFLYKTADLLYFG